MDGSPKTKVTPLLAPSNRNIRRRQRQGLVKLERWTTFVAKPTCHTKCPDQLRLPVPQFMLLLGGLYPLVSGQQHTVNLDQLVSLLPEVPGEQLTASFGMGDRGAAVASLVGATCCWPISAWRRATSWRPRARLRAASSKEGCRLTTVPVNLASSNDLFQG